jgi:hypothetical protein
MTDAATTEATATKDAPPPETTPNVPFDELIASAEKVAKTAAEAAATAAADSKVAAAAAMKAATAAKTATTTAKKSATLKVATSAQEAAETAAAKAASTAAYAKRTAEMLQTTKTAAAGARDDSDDGDSDGK